jgi:hypothetical protein
VPELCRSTIIGVGVATRSSGESPTPPIILPSTVRGHGIMRYDYVRCRPSIRRDGTPSCGPADYEGRREPSGHVASGCLAGPPGQARGDRGDAKESAGRGPGVGLPAERLCAFAAQPAHPPIGRPLRHAPALRSRPRGFAVSRGEDTRISLGSGHTGRGSPGECSSRGTAQSTHRGALGSSQRVRRRFSERSPRQYSDHPGRRAAYRRDAG